MRVLRRARPSSARWPPPALDVVLLGPSRDACRRYLAGADLDTGWMRTTLPELAWRSVYTLRGARA